MSSSKLIIFLTLILTISTIYALQSTNIRIRQFINNPHANALHLNPVEKDDNFKNGGTTKDTKAKPTDMKIRDIQAELRSLNYTYSDCFDRESLVKRLLEARTGGKMQDVLKAVKKEKKFNSEKSKNTKFDRETAAQELRSLRVSELRSRLASRNIRWRQYIEKQDLVNALLNAMEESRNFSSSGVLSPGKVGDVSHDELRMELEGTELHTPLLVDVYATWCGPCQLMMGQMDAAALEFGNDVRMAKIDSDKYPKWSSSVQVEGLPTLILFNSEGKEISRKEGLLMKDDIVTWIRNSKL